MVIGHEASGVIEQVGPNVNGFQVGDHVVFVFVPSCGSCSPCAEGRPALCEPAAQTNSKGVLPLGTSRISQSGKSIHHHLGVSSFAEKCVVSVKSLVKIDKSLPFDEAALFGCAVITGVGAVVNTARVSPGSSVAVAGLGGVGLASVLGAVASGASPIIAIDVLPEKLQLARQLGATHVIDAKQANLVEQVREWTNGGVDYAFEMAGSVQAMDTCYRITRRGGMTVSGGLSHPDHKWNVAHVTLVAEERTVKGSYIGSCVPVRDIPRFIALFKAGKLPVDKLKSETLKLDQINEGFDRLASGQSVRQVIVF